MESLKPGKGCKHCDSAPIKPQPYAAFSVCLELCQVLASFLVQDLEAEGLNPLLLTYVANSLFIVYLPLYYIAMSLRATRSIDR